MSRIYKEGQGKWARGLLVGIVMLGAILALRQLHDVLPRAAKVTLPVIGFDLDYRFLIHGPLLIAAAWFAFYLFNRPATADYLIDTETELRTKVTWPSQQEEVKSSIIVVVTVLVLAMFIFGIDQLCTLVVSRGWYASWF